MVPFVARKWLLAASEKAALAAAPAFAAKDVVVAVGSNFTTLDPYDANDTLSQAVAKSFYQGLFGLDREMKLKNVLAEGYTVSSDGRTYTFQLREDACWSDGSAVTADDFVFAFRRLFGPGSVSPYAENLLSVQNAEAILAGEMQPEALGVRAADDHTLVLTLEKADSGITTPQTRQRLRPERVISR